MKLEEMCTVFTDGDWIESKDQSDEGIRLIQTGNIGEGTYLDKGIRAKYISEDTFKKLKCTQVYSGDILVSRLPEPVGRACIIPEKEESMITAVDCTICRPDESIVSKEYLCYFMRSNAYYTRLLSGITGTTRKRISRKNLGNIELDIPSKKEQKKVVKQLDYLVKVVDLRKQELVALDNLIKARFVELFGDPMTDVSKWRASTIGEQFNVASGGTPATGEKAYWENGTIPWIGSNMCQDTILSENDGKFITEEGYAHSSAKWFHKGTVLVALVGATIGKTALLRFDTTTNQNIAAIDVTQNAAFSSEFVFYHMQMLYSKFMEIGSGKFKMANQDFIRQLPLICPPIELQEQFAAFVEQTDKSKVVVSTNIVYNIKRIKT